MKVIIVGQGIAGTILAYLLMGRGQEVVVIDPGKSNNASKVAAGIINPITGRRYVKSWRVEEFVRFAKPIYRQLEQLLAVDLYHDYNLTRALHNNKQETDWLLRSSFPEYEKFMVNPPELGIYKDFVQPAYSWAELTGSAQVNISKLVIEYRKRLEAEGCLITEQLDHDQLDLSGDGVGYKGVQADRIVFCEGYQSRSNPLFRHLAHEPAKGEALIVRIPGLQASKMLKSNSFLVPLGDEEFWVGANYDWEFKDDLPTDVIKRQLLKNLEATIAVDYEVILHQAAVRPVFKDRRPKVGPHERFKQVYLFNGLGTKGASQAPFWADQLVRHLLDGVEIDHEVRF